MLKGIYFLEKNMKKIFFPFFILLIVVIFVLGISFANKKNFKGAF